MTKSHNGRTGNRVLLSVGLALGLALLAAVSQAGSSLTQNHIRFGVAVALPGAVLQAGHYTFEIANPDSGGDVVRVWTRDHARAVFAGFTHRIPRPSNMPRTQALSLGEPPAVGAPQPILAWFPVGDSRGYEFVYR